MKIGSEAQKYQKKDLSERSQLQKISLLNVEHTQKTFSWPLKLENKSNQSRICGKGVGLGLFPSDSLQSQLYEFIEIAHMDHTMVYNLTVEYFVRTVRQFLRKSKKVEKRLFFGHFRANFGYVSHIRAIQIY